MPQMSPAVSNDSSRDRTRTGMRETPRGKNHRKTKCHPLWGHVSKSGSRPRGENLYPREMPFVETLEHAAHFRTGAEAYAGQTAPWDETEVPG